MINIQKLLQRKLFLIIPVVILFLGLLIFGSFIAKQETLRLIQTYFPSLTKNTFLETSTATLSIEDKQSLSPGGNKKLRIDFEIIKKDEDDLKRFSDLLGVDTNWSEGISINLDEDSLAKVSRSLPTTVNLEFKEKGIGFSNNSLPSLDSALLGDSYSFATDSGKLTYRTSGNSVNLNISNPEPLLQYATSSGKLNISLSLQPLFPLLQKIDTINLSVKDKSISGDINLR